MRWWFHLCQQWHLVGPLHTTICHSWPQCSEYLTVVRGHNSTMFISSWQTCSTSCHILRQMDCMACST
uniref:Putative secreted protein n=1 Tax=Panstrongylus lignarius TaxID=156445 RepID=A0A224Y6Z6_9HEMI